MIYLVYSKVTILYILNTILYACMYNIFLVSNLHRLIKLCKLWTSNDGIYTNIKETNFFA